MKHPRKPSYWLAQALLAGLTGTASTICLAGSAILDGSTTPNSLPRQLTGPQFILDESLGLRRGDNLFHSLLELQIDEGEGLFLTGSSTISNVLLRVTGGNVTSIDGQLSLLVDDANLFLLNPAGVIFGERARISVPGSLIVSTGDAIPFSDGSTLPASGPLPNLSAAPPAAWHDYGAPLSGSIRVEAVLEVDGGAFLLADRITFDQGALVAGASPFTGTVPPPARRARTPGPLWLLANRAIELNGLPSATLGNVNSFNWSASNADAIRLSSPLISFDAGAVQSLTLGPGNGADMHFEARDQISLGGLIELDSPEGPVERFAAIGSGARGGGNGGNLTVLTNRFTMTDRAAIVLAGAASGEGGSQRYLIGEGGMHLGPQTLIASFARPTVARERGVGDGGRIEIDVQGPLVMAGAIPDGAPLSGFNMGIVSKTQSSARAGDISVQAISLLVADGGRIESGALGTGRSGNVRVEAAESVTVRGSSSLLSSLIGVLASDLGSVGDTQVIAPDIQILDGGSIRADSLGSGDAGTLTLRADRLRIAGAGAPIDEVLFTQWLAGLGEGTADTFDEDESAVRLLQAQLGALEAVVASDALGGQGGDLVIEVGALEIGDGGLISATALGDADGGDIRVDADRVTLTGDAAIVTDAGRFLEDTAPSATGNAGQIAIRAHESIRLTGGEVSSNSLGLGNAGSIALTAPQIDLNGSQAIISTVSEGSGDAGSIQLAGDSVRVTGGVLSAQARGAGSGGNVQVQANDSLSLIDATVTASSGAAGGGSLQIGFGASSPAVIRDSVLSAETQTGDEQAGSIVVQGGQPDLSTVVISGSQLLANADGGAAGNVLVEAGTVLRDSGTRLAASNRAGLSGSVLVREQSPNTQIDAVTEAPEPIDPSTQIGACRSAHTGSLWVRHTGSPESPASVLLAMSRDATEPLNASAESPPSHSRSLVLADTLSTRSVRAALAADDLRDAEHLAHRAIKLTKTPETLATKAVVDYARADYLAAAKAFDETARLAARRKDETLLARARANAARAWLLAGDPNRALERLREAQSLASRLAVGAERALLMLHVGQTWMSATGLPGAEAGWPRLSALTALRDAHATAQSISDRADLLAWSLGTLSELYAIDQRFDDAMTLAHRALAAGENTVDAYRWYRQVARLSRESGETDQALAFYARAMTLSSRAAGDARGSQTREAHFRRQIAPVYLEYADLLLSLAERGHDQFYQQHLLDAREVVNRLHAAEIRDYLDEACSTDAQPDTRRLRLPSDTAVLFPVVFDDRVELLMQTDRGIQRGRSIPLGREALRKQVASVREQLRDPRRSASREASQALYRTAFRDLHELLAENPRISRLIVVPDGPLRSLPFGALHDGERWLAQRVTVEIMQRLAPSASLGQPASGTPSALLAGVSRFGSDERRALPFVPEELAGVGAAWRGPRSVLRDEQFTRLSFTQALRRKQPQVVHLATHGTFAGSLERSYLVTGDGEQLGIAELFAPLQRLAAQQQPVALVVLSACDTAVGVERSSIGLAGVALRAGAAHAAGSLWPVPDDGTAQLFSAFYAALQGPARNDPGWALTSAQRKLIAAERYAHPAYWAGFQIIRNGIAWSPTDIPAATTLALAP
ncbi:MAG: CHAT domain-containing protein [Pseudomonadota bacterium]